MVIAAKTVEKTSGWEGEWRIGCLCQVQIGGTPFDHQRSYLHRSLYLRVQRHPLPLSLRHDVFEPVRMVPMAYGSRRVLANSVTLEQQPHAKCDIVRELNYRVLSIGRVEDALAA